MDKLSTKHHHRVVIQSLRSDAGPHSDPDTIEATYLVCSDNGSTTLSQPLTLRWDREGWVATMPMNDLPPQMTSTSAAWKLADWMERMAQAIKGREFDQINLNNLSCTP